MHKLDAISKWFLSLLVLIMVMVVIGGITRLTGSGLSMVDWRPIFGFLPPLTEIQWQSVFAQYQLSPEFKYINYNMDLMGFKKIFMWEYLHRVLGRIIGLAALVPALVFWRRGLFSSLLKKQSIIIVLSVIIQGGVGWYMVVSGLVDNPYVSHFRLALHLVLAFGLFAYILYLLCGRIYDTSHSYKSRVLFKFSVGLLCLLFVQLIYGAFVAGLKAGLVSATFPRMGDVWLPSSALVMTPILKNSIYNPVMIHFIHRCLGWLIWGYSLIFYISVLRLPLHFRQRWAFRSVVLFVTFQFVLGVGTVVFEVPILLALLHQLNGLFVLASIVWLVYETKVQ